MFGDGKAGVWRGKRGKRRKRRKRDICMGKVGAGRSKDCKRGRAARNIGAVVEESSGRMKNGLASGSKSKRQTDVRTGGPTNGRVGRRLLLF